jgi:hypothetical protein
MVPRYHSVERPVEDCSPNAGHPRIAVAVITTEILPAAAIVVVARSYLDIFRLTDGRGDDVDWAG